MRIDSVAEHLLNPGVIATLVAAGFLYGRVLWALNIRPIASLVITAVVPGVMFLATLWTIRAILATPSIVWPVLMIDWLVFAGSGVAAVLVMRQTKRGT